MHARSSSHSSEPQPVLPLGWRGGGLGPTGASLLMRGLAHAEPLRSYGRTAFTQS